MKTRAQALADAGRVLGEVVAIVSKLTPREAAERAWHPGGPSVDILTQQITEDRARRGLASSTRTPGVDAAASIPSGAAALPTSGASITTTVPVPPVLRTPRNTLGGAA